MVKIKTFIKILVIARLKMGNIFVYMVAKEDGTDLHVRQRDTLEGYSADLKLTHEIGYKQVRIYHVPLKLVSTVVATCNDSIQGKIPLEDLDAKVRRLIEDKSQIE